MRQFCPTLDKQEKRYDIYSSIGYRCINKMSASKRKKKVNYTTLKVLRDTHYEYFRCMECFWFFVNILWRHVLVSRRKMRRKFLFSVYQISKRQRQPFFSAKFMWHFCPVWIPHDVSLYRMKNI